MSCLSSKTIPTEHTYWSVNETDKPETQESYFKHKCPIYEEWFCTCHNMLMLWSLFVLSPGDALLRPQPLKMLPFTLNRLTISLQPSLEKFESQLLQLINADCHNTVRPFIHNMHSLDSNSNSVYHESWATNKYKHSLSKCVFSSSHIHPSFKCTVYDAYNEKTRHFIVDIKVPTQSR